MKKDGEILETGKNEEEDKEQSKKFIETAKELETDETGRSFHKLVDSLAQKNPPSKTPTKTDS